MGSVSVGRVPFPAVTVDAGDTQNPWGIIEKLFRFVDFECYDSPYDCPADKEAPLEDLRFFTDKIVERFFEVCRRNFLTMTTSDIQEWHEDNTEPSSYTFPGFEKAVATFSLIMAKNRSRSDIIEKQLLKITSSLFAKVALNRRYKDYRKARRFGSKLFLPAIEKEATLLEINDTSTMDCMSNQNLCFGAYKEAYVTLLLPFMFLRVPTEKVPYTGLSLGDYMSYFARSSQALQSYPSGHRFLAYGPPETQEQLVRFLKHVSKHLSVPDVNIFDVTTYELSRLLDRSAFSHHELPGLNERKCNEVVHLKDSWDAYLSNTKYASILDKDIRDHYADFKEEQPPCFNKTLFEYERPMFYSSYKAYDVGACCAAMKPWRLQHDSVLKLLKYNMQPPHFLQREDELRWDLSLAGEAFKGYRLKNINDVPIWNTNPRIFKCQYNNLDQPDSLEDATRCFLFSRSYTSSGFGYTFNNRDFWDLYSPTNEFNKIFSDTMFPQLKEEGNRLLYPSSTGSKYGLTFSVQQNRKKLCLFNTCSENEFKVRLDIHDPAAPGDPRGSGFEVEAGYLTTFLITPSQLSMSSDAEKLDVQSRNCKFKHETGGLEIFTSYSQKGCQLECMLKIAVDICRCTPWNYPMLNTSIGLCDFIGANCFEKVRLHKATE